MLILKPHLKQTLLIEMPVADGVHFILYTALKRIAHISYIVFRDNRII